MGIPVYLQSDYGSYLSHKFQAVLKMLGVQHLVGSANKPSTQELVERVHRQLKVFFFICVKMHIIGIIICH